MPASIIGSTFQKTGISKKTLEKMWEEAGKSAEHGKPEQKYALQMHIFQNMVQAYKKKK